MRTGIRISPSAAAGVAPELVRRLIAARSGGASVPAPVGPRCPACGGRLVLLGFGPAAVVPVFDTS